MSCVIDLSLILFNTSDKIYSIPKESKYPALFLLLHTIPTLMTLLPRTFIIKGSANNDRNLPSSSFPALKNPLQLITFSNDTATDCINGEATGAINEIDIIAENSPPSCCCFFYLMFQYHHSLIDLAFSDDFHNIVHIFIRNE